MDGYGALVTYKAMKRLRVRIKPPDGAVTVSAPIDTPDHVIERFLDANHQWILQTQAAVRLRSPHPERLVTGGRIRLWGTWHEVERLESTRASAKLVGNRIHIRCPTGDDEAARRAVEALYRREMAPALDRLREEWEPRVGRSRASQRVGDEGRLDRAGARRPHLCRRLDDVTEPRAGAFALAHRPSITEPPPPGQANTHQRRRGPATGASAEEARLPRDAMRTGSIRSRPASPQVTVTRVPRKGDRPCSHGATPGAPRAGFRPRTPAGPASRPA